jgi:surface carbohydrate biosynthesis protein (TIGR04326 family)
MDTIVIWDHELAPPPSGDWTTVLWSGFPTGAANEISIPLVVEARAEELRGRFLDWIYRLGETRIGGKAAVDHLELRPGFSYWWMTLLSHAPNYYEASFVTDVVKCLAFEGLAPVADAPLRTIRLHSGNRLLHGLIKQYCHSRGLEFLAQESPPAALPASPAPGFRDHLRRLTGWASAGVQSFRPDEAPGATSTRATVCVFDVLVHLRREAIDQGMFASQYWTSLHAALASTGAPTTWVHTFFRHADVPSVGAARKLVARFNRNGRATERHLLVDRLSAAIVLSAVRSYVRLLAAAVRMRSIRRAFTPERSGFNFWPLFRRTWHTSLIGRAAVRNCLTLAMYERLLPSLQHQATGIYIKENQPWEMALLHAWRNAGHGRIIGVPHSTVRFWDLRYFYDRRSYGETGTHTVPRPDLVAVNGPAARAAYIAGGYPASELADVEALRFLHVATVSASSTARPADAELQVLICGDNVPANNARMLALVRAAAPCLPGKARFIFKPHKAAPLDAASTGPDIEVRDGDLGQMLRDCDFVLTGSLTSAAVDAYCLGKAVASLCDGRSLNGSPLRGMNGARQFTSASELVAILASAGRTQTTTAEPYFWLDPAIPRWKALLALPAA